MNRVIRAAATAASVLCLTGAGAPAFSSESRVASTAALSCVGTSSTPAIAGGSVRAGATVSCTQTVRSIRVEAKLFGPNRDWYIGTRTCSNVRVCSVNVSGTFMRGVWFSSGSGAVTADGGATWSGDWAGAGNSF